MGSPKPVLWMFTGLKGTVHSMNAAKPWYRELFAWALENVEVCSGLSTHSGS